MFMPYILQIFKINNYGKNYNTGLLFGICKINLSSGVLIMFLNNLAISITLSHDLPSEEDKNFV